MPDRKKDLGAMLGGDTSRPAIRRGQGMRLSTEALPDDKESQERTITESQSRENAEPQKRNQPKRVNRGYMLREDLIRAIKIVAVQEDRNLYEVMEEALEQYLERHRES